MALLLRDRWSKEPAMPIADRGFASLVAGVEEGRAIFENIRKS
jgi:hypothetical protein